jgi:hypothetical protein
MKMKMKMPSLLAGACAALLAFSSTGSAQTVLYNFDTYTLGNLHPQGGWYSNTAVQVTNAESVSPSNSVQLPLGASAYGDIDPAISITDTDTWRLSANFYMGTDNYAQLAFRNSDNKLVLGAKLRQSNGSFESAGGALVNITSTTGPTAFTANTWYTLQLDLTPSTGAYSVTVLKPDDSVFSSVSGTGSPGTYRINSIQIYNVVTSASGDVYFDNVAVSVVPEPTTLVLSGMSLVVLMACRRRRRSVV